MFLICIYRKTRVYIVLPFHIVDMLFPEDGGNMLSLQSILFFPLRIINAVSAALKIFSKLSLWICRGQAF